MYLFLRIFMVEVGMNKISRPMLDLASATNDLTRLLFKIPGAKQLTVVSSQADPFQIDMQCNGFLGTELRHDLLFKAKLAVAFSHTGYLFIGQRLPMKIARYQEGNLVWIGWQRIYGIHMHQGNWHPLSKAAVKYRYRVMGRDYPQLWEDNQQVFCDFPIF